VEVDGYGRVTTGTNPSTLAGYGITDGQQLNANLTSLSGVSTAGVLASWGAQAVTNAVQKTSNAISKAIKKNSAKLKYGTFVYLINSRSNQKDK
jgi:hypothetical protein